MPYASFDELGSSNICGEFPEGFKHHALRMQTATIERTAS
jgi:hypothetical protein